MDFAQQLKSSIDIVAVVGERVPLKRRGAYSWAGLCPFHQEKSGSFHVHQEKQFYKCFGCGASGYPYATNPITIPIETDYLLNVVPQEMPLSFAVPAIEAWYLCGRDDTVTEAAWLEGSEAGRPRREGRSLALIEPRRQSAQLRMSAKHDGRPRDNRGEE